MANSIKSSTRPQAASLRCPPSGADATAAVALLSNGSYSVLITGAGAGYGSWRDLDITRWREDRTRDCWGQFCYVRDQMDSTLWSIGKQPLLRPQIVYGHAFYGDRADFRCVAEDIEVSWSVCVAPDIDAEVRMLTIANYGNRERDLEFTNYSEVCLNDRRADRAHPAFAKLFVETRFDQETAALFARRRPRDTEQKPLWAVHVSASTVQDQQLIGYETDRLKFLGRGRTIENPIAFEGEALLSRTVGPVLDPIFCLQRKVHLRPGAIEKVAFVTGAGDNQQAVQAIAERYSHIHAVERAFSDASQNYRNELGALDLTADRVVTFNRLAEKIVFAAPASQHASDFKKGRLSKEALWSCGISGDLPIALVHVDADGDAALVREVTIAHDFSRRRGLHFDLVLLDQRGADQASRLTEELQAGSAAELMGKPGGIFVLSDASPGDQLKTIEAAARVVLSSSRGLLADQLIRGRPAASPGSPLTASRGNETPCSAVAGNVATDLLYWNGFGGFSADGREYVVLVDNAKSQASGLPPAPWSNVIANPDFGFLTSESGLGYTWWGNSQMNRLTPWSNDPISDAPGEVVYLRDEETGDVWTPTPLPLGQRTEVTVRHGQGYTRYESTSSGLHQDMAVYVSPKDAVKIVHLRLTSNDTRTRHLSATFYAEWVLGTQREDAAMQVVCQRDAQSGAIMARNVWAKDFAGVAFVAASRTARAATSDRSEFLGAYGSVSRPAAMEQSEWTERFGSFSDPCAAIMVDVALAPGESDDVIFVLGEADNPKQVRRLVRQYIDLERVRESLAATGRQWDHMLTALEVSTPDVGLNLMMNRWLLYQILACRVWARTSNYQSGGAYGFRDQLQDVMALVYCAPDETRSHILRAAGRQFEEGDVQHWWHPPSGVGVRTRMTDDLYFLPFVVHHYVSTTGDSGVLDEQVPFIRSPVLRKDQDEDFNRPDIGEIGTVYEHCLRALEHGFRLGRHGLPLMGTGDWNDGMNKVGAEGQGESVWNGWFFLTVLKAFAEISASRGDQGRATWCRERAEELRAALEANAWDGAWYRRAYFDDGTPLGSSLNDECQIDAIPQAWAVISGEADKGRARQAMDSVYERLVRQQDKLIQLFDPPFDKGRLQPGYIKGYVPGIRENGGQYTHAAAWVVLAAALLGDGDRAWQLWNLINPINHGATAEHALHYMVEPYVISADVYGAPPHTGRGGWTWYTGSASWLYRVALESILGFRRRGEILWFEPCIPSNWTEYDLKYRYGSATYRIHVDNAAGVGHGVSRVMDQGQLMADGRVHLNDDGRSHDILVLLGSETQRASA